MAAVRPYIKPALLVLFLILVSDQLSKWWVLAVLDLPSKGSVPVLPFLNLTMVWNEGISMGLLPADWANRYGLVALTGAISVWLFVWLFKSVRKIESIALAMILGGAIGNIIDRLIHGAVVDFVHLHALEYSFYVFNVADSAITIGVILLLIDGLLDGDKGPKNAPKEVSDHRD